MQARFVSLAIGYSLGTGSLRRKGIKQQPWLELKRLELEATYLGHQVKLLRSCHGSALTAKLDMLPGEGIYDISRARLQSPWMERVLELLTPGGEFRITPGCLQVAGLRGLASLWLDIGQWRYQAGHLPMQGQHDAVSIHDALKAAGVGSSIGGRTDSTVQVNADEMTRFTKLIRPEVHRSMRHALHPGSKHGLQLLKRGIA
jgi:hypothetical protein